MFGPKSAFERFPHDPIRDHFGTLMALCFLKGSELAVALQKYKGRVVFRGDDVKDDTWVELGYALDGYNFFLGAGDGGYVTDGDGFAPVLAGVSFGSDNGYTATFQYNIDSETPLLIVSKSW